MDVNAITSGLYTDHSLRGSDVVNVEKKNANEDDRNTLFVNYAAIAWHEMRRAWRGDRSSASPKKPREPTRHCSNTSMEGRFDEPVPLSCGKKTNMRLFMTKTTSAFLVAFVLTSASFASR